MRPSRTLFAAVAALAAAARLFPQPMSEHREKQPENVELASPEVAVPFELVKGRPVVSVRIGDKGPFPFVLDTGAGGTVIEAELAAELGLSVSGEVRIGDPLQPHSIPAKQVRIELLAVGGASFSGASATAMENAGFSSHLGARGVLGMPVFADLLLSIDFGKMELRMARGALPDPDGKEVLAFRRGMGGTIRVPISVASLSIDADLDSGSPAGLSLPDAYMETLPLEGKPVEMGRARTVNSEFVVHGAALRGAVAIGATRIENPSLRFNALPVANVGTDLLRRFAVTIDQRNSRIRFHEIAGAGVGG